jgi:hypothetical protein
VVSSILITMLVSPKPAETVEAGIAKQAPIPIAAASLNSRIAVLLLRREISNLSGFTKC